MFIDQIFHQLLSFCRSVRIRLVLILALFATATSWAAENEIIVTSTTTTMKNGTYRVANDVTFEELIIISGDVTLILDEGATLDAKKGINVTEGNSLTIDGEGALKATGVSQAAGIGVYFGPCGIITINGGTVTATGGAFGAGIGGSCLGVPGNCYGEANSGGTITINGGTIAATGGDYAAGIGGGFEGSGGTITINGGTLVATGGNGGAGIGGGFEGSGGTITINGGTIAATGVLSGAGIGGGGEGNGGSIIINDGTVTATGSSGGAGIGGGSEGNGGSIIINGGKVTATGTASGGAFGAGIGPGERASQSGSVTLGWTNEDDFIYASSYNVSDIKFAEDKQFYYVEGGVKYSATMDNISGKKILPFIDEFSLKNAKISGVKSFYLYTGNEINISYDVIDFNGKVLSQGSDYILSITPLLVKDKGKYKLIVTAIEGGKYKGAKTFYFEVGDPIPVTSATVLMNDDGVYKVSSDVTMNSRIQVNGDVTLLLEEGKTLNATKGIEVLDGYSLTIEGKGTLNATGAVDFAGIGGGKNEVGGTIIINGGKVSANGRYDAPGIGSGLSAHQGGSVILGWTNEDDFIYASSYNVADLKFADGKQFYYVDEDGNSVKATKENIGNHKILPLIDDVNRNLNNAVVSRIKPYYLYTGKEINIQFEVTDVCGKILTEGDDYLASISSINNSMQVMDKGEYTLTITAKEGCGYTGSKSFDFSVVDYFPVISSMTEMNGNYGVPYKVIENVSIDERITIKGDATLILGEGTTLEATKGIEVSEGNSLTIDGKGALNATGARDVHGVSGDAGIGGNMFGSCGSITINGGKVMAKGGDDAAGIGPGYIGYEASQNCSVTLGWTNEDDFIYASSYNALSQRYVEGIYVLGFEESKISFAEGKQFYYVDEYGNYVKATKENIGNHKILPMTDAVNRNLKYATISGIKGYYSYTGNEINIEYEVVDVSGKKLDKDVDYVASVNASEEQVKEKGEYTVTITAKEGSAYNGIKTVHFAVVDAVQVTGETIEMTNGIYRVSNNVDINTRINIVGDVILILGEGTTLNAKKGIELSEGNKLTIEGKGSLNATGDNYDSGIGAEKVGTLIINDGNVNAAGGKYGAGIGGSNKNSVGGSITINGGTVTASGGTVTARGNRNAYGIGGGYSGDNSMFGVCGRIIINGGKVTAMGIGGVLTNDSKIILGWTNEDDFVYYVSGNVSNISFAEGKQFYYLDENDNPVLATKENIGGRKILPITDGFNKVNIIGIRPYYVYTKNDINLQYTVNDILGDELVEGKDFTVSINPYPVKDVGEYLFTLTTKNESKVVRFFVVKDYIPVASLNSTKIFSMDGDYGIPYKVTKNETIDERIVIKGDVKLILDEGFTLNATKGIELSDGNKLTIEGKGTLNATGESEQAGIGAHSVGTLVINDGNVNATGGEYGAGIGGSSNNTVGGVVTINGGTVSATGGDYAAGIGGGYTFLTGEYGVCGIITINGGKVAAFGHAYQSAAVGNFNVAGIGPGLNGPVSGSVTLGWTNEDDYIYASSYGVDNLSFAEDKSFLFVENEKVIRATIDNIDGKILRPDITKSLRWATISGIEPYYIITGENVNVTYKVTDLYDNELKEGIDYTESFNPSPVKEKGEYTLTITAKEGSGYTGSQSVTFTVLDYIPVTSSTTTMDGRYGVPYKVTKDVSIDDRIHIKGDVKLILGEGTTLDARKGIELREKNALTIEGKGTLNATGDQNYAGIGAAAVGSLVIRDGVINARGGSFSAGIGGSYANTYGGEITIYGGVVNATGGYYASGIGGGSYYSTNNNDVSNVGYCGTVNIYGGQVTAKAGEPKNASGIGPGYKAPQRGSVTLGWTNKDDFIYAESYGDVESLSFADGKLFYYTDADGKHKMDEANANVLRGRTIYPYLQYDLKYATISGLEASYSYTGKNIVLAYTVKDFEENVLSSDDYDVMIKKNGATSEAVKVGEYSIEFSGKGEYGGSFEKTFSIVPEVVGNYAAVQVLRDENGDYAVIDGDYSGTGKIAVGEDEDVVKVELDRTLSTTGYATITLPFGIDSAKVKGAKQFLKFVGVILNEETKLREVHFERAWCDLPALLKDIDNLKDLSAEEKEKKKAKVSAKCNAVPKKLFAYTPYVVQMKNNSLEFDGSVTLVKTPAAVDTVVGNWKFKGTLAPKVWEEGDPEIGNAYGYVAGTGEFKKVGENSSIGALRSYLVYEKQSSGTQSSANVPGMSNIRANFSTEFLPANMDVVIADDDENGKEHRTVIGKFNTHTGEFKFLMPESGTFDVKGRRVNETRSVGKGRKAKGVYYGKRGGRD